MTLSKTGNRSEISTKIYHTPHKRCVTSLCYVTGPSLDIGMSGWNFRFGCAIPLRRTRTRRFISQTDHTTEILQYCCRLYHTFVILLEVMHQRTSFTFVLAETIRLQRLFLRRYQSSEKWIFLMIIQRQYHERGFHFFSNPLRIMLAVINAKTFILSISIGLE